MAKDIVVAVDGFASCGKSTLAKTLAKKLGYIYIDSGAMYRAVMLYFLDHNIDINDKAALRKGLKNAQITFAKNPDSGYNEVCLNGKNVEKQIRDMRVSKTVSELSKLKEVRQEMVNIQRKIGSQKGIVMDGRDIGSVVFPNAELKIFMTADFDERVRRRYEELKSKGTQISRKEVEHNLQERDYIDTNRKESPLIKAPGAIEINNTHLTPETQLEQIYTLAIDKIQS